MSSETHTEEAHEEHAGMSKKEIIKIFVYLLAITAIEFIIALYLVPHNIIPLRFANPLYIFLTLAKAFYIVAYFMHLKFEKVGLAYSVGVPILFIIGLILVLTNESHHWADVWHSLSL
jgi:cytochrome c oxidase subunit 4